MSKVSSFAFAALIALAGAACGKDDPITAIDRSTDCAQICDQWKDCIDGDYDVEACTDDCSDMVSDNETARIDDCENCLDDASCGEGLACVDECAGVIKP